MPYRAVDDPTPPTAHGRSPVGTGRYAGPLLLPEQPAPEHNLRNKVIYVLVSVLLFAAAGYGLYRITMPRTGRPTATADDSSRGGPAAPPVTAHPSASRKPPPHPKSPLRDNLHPSGTPMPVGDIPGWYQTFTDDFVGDQLNDAWFTYDGEPGGDKFGWFASSHVSVSGGLLTISAFKENSPNGLIYVTGGMSNRNVFSQKYGRFDVRFRADLGVGIAYAILLWPSDEQWPPEVDIVEDNGRDRKQTQATMHYDPDDKKITRRTNADFTQWHTATIEWTPGHLVYELDGRQWATIDSPHVPDEGMELAIQTQASGCGGWEACPNSTTPQVVNLQVDWVSIYGSTSR
jgi:hypothetical protein